MAVMLLDPMDQHSAELEPLLMVACCLTLIPSHVPSDFQYPELFSEHKKINDYEFNTAYINCSENK